MHGRLKSLELRFARIAGFVRAGDKYEAHERSRLQVRKVIAGLIREGLTRAGLNPDDSPTLRDLETPDPLPPPPRRWRPIDPRVAFCEQMTALAARMRQPPRLASASPVALLAYYCFGPGARADPDPAPA
ncbi:MAG TPA: hypothetical protein VME45_13315 [Stellaceae bacterium]|nr:hypothetical protein [Stellaceae bacterium]